MATFTNAWDEAIPKDDYLDPLSEAGKVDDLLRQMRLDLRERMLKFLPVGMIIKWPIDIVPDGFMECDGASLSRTEYAALFAVLSTTYGTADSSHFNIPDYRGYFLRGWDHGAAIDPDAATRTATTKPGATMTAGDHVGTIQQDENKQHSHRYLVSDPKTDPAHAWQNYWRKTGSTANQGDEGRPINIYFKYIIRVDGIDTDDIYTRDWDENNPVDLTYMGRIAMEIRKLKVDTKERINAFFPAGMICYWPTTTPPTGYMKCDGSSLSQSTYPDLYDAIGDAFGPGSGVDTFNIPDCRGYFIRAQDNGAGVDSLASSRSDRGDGIVGDFPGTKQADENKQHNHSAYVTGGMSDPPASSPYYMGSPSPTIPAERPHAYYRALTEYDKSRTVDFHPKNIYVMAVIKVSNE